jgi:serine/threonine protein kinase
MSTAIPQRLGDFEVVREIGRGGMGVVYEARQVSLNRKVALKVLSGGPGLNGKAVQRFRREAEAAAQLHHTNIVPVYAIGEEDGTHFYAMERIDGPSLDYVIRQLRRQRRAACGPGEPGRDGARSPRGAHATPPAHPDLTGPYVASADASPVPPPPLRFAPLGSGGAYFDVIARLVAEVADALDYAHANGVIHRDVKPSNLLLLPAGRLSLYDFGLARVQEQPGMTDTGEFVGTPAYVSPEQITAGHTPLDHRTDIYSLGATLYELLTLQPPFAGSRRDQVLAQILHKEPRPPRKVNPQVPVDLETICLKALEKDPDRRYQTAGAMADDLRRHVNHCAISARRAGLMTLLVKWVRRQPALAATLAVALLAGLAAGFFACRAHRHEQEFSEAKRQNVLDKALVAAMGGDFDGAEKALGEAELLRASTGQVSMLRGHVAFHRCQSKEAVEHLRQAARLLPESVATRSMLAVAYMNVGQWDMFEQTMREAEQLTPRTPEDYLFKGYAESLVHPERGVGSLKEAIRLRPSVIAHLLRADAQNNLAMDLADLEKAEVVAQAAMTDADTAKRLFAGNVFALTTSVEVHLTAARIYEDTYQLDKRDEALARAREDARSLEAHASLPDACCYLWALFREEGEADAVLEKLRRVHEQTGHELATFYYAATLYRRKEFAAGLGALEKTRGASANDLFRLLVLADLDGNPARAFTAYQDLAGLDLDGWTRLNSLMLLQLLGHKRESEALCRELGKRPDRFPLWQREGYRRLLDYAAGKLSAEGLLAATAASRQTQCFAHYYIALTLLAEGDRAKAREHFHKAMGTRAWSLPAYDMSWVSLGRLEADPNWPPWIPVKK